MHATAVTSGADRPSFAVRAVGVAAAWALGALPVVLGLQRCPVAAFLHASCPGCGLTRAVRLLLAGDIAASFHMHPLAVPSIVASALVMAATTWVTWKRGAPTELMREPLGRAAAWTFVGVQALLLALWIARFFGALGGPVPV
jgi:hypothetical protein